MCQFNLTLIIPVVRGHSVLHDLPPSKENYPSILDSPCEICQYSPVPLNKLNTIVVNYQQKYISFFEFMLKKHTAILHWVILSNTMQSVRFNKTKNYLIKVKKGNIRARRSKLTITVPEHHNCEAAKMEILRKRNNTWNCTLGL